MKIIYFNLPEVCLLMVTAVFMHREVFGCLD